MKTQTQLVALISIFTLSHSAVAQVKFNALPDLGFGGVAYDANEAGTIVGLAVIDANHRLEPAVWNSKLAAPTTLPTQGFGGFATAVSESGIVVGSRFAEVGSGTVPVLWLNGKYQELETLGEGGAALDVNDSGQVVGYVNSAGGNLPAIWEGGKLSVLPILPVGAAGDILNGSANSINALGHVVGTVRVAFGADSLALKWVNKEVRLSGLTEWIETRGLKVNAAGDALINGYFGPNGTFALATFSASGQPTTLPAPLEGTPVWGTGFSSSGLVVGFYRELIAGPSALRPIAYRNGVIEPLELPDGATWAYPLGVTDEGTAVGFASDTVNAKSTPGYWSLGGDGDVVTLTPSNGTPGTEVVFTATVKRGKGAVSGRRVQFQVNRKDIGNGTSSTTGKAKIKYVIPADAAPGTREVMASLGGGRYSLAPLTINWVSTTVAAHSTSGPKNAQVNITGTLLNSTTKQPIAGQVVRFVHNGKTYAARTTATGSYSIPFTVPATAVSGTTLAIEVKYNGNVNHKSAAAKASIRVN